MKFIAVLAIALAVAHAYPSNETHEPQPSNPATPPPPPSTSPSPSAAPAAPVAAAAASGHSQAQGPPASEPLTRSKRSTNLSDLPDFPSKLIIKISKTGEDSDAEAPESKPSTRNEEAEHVRDMVAAAPMTETEAEDTDREHPTPKAKAKKEEAEHVRDIVSTPKAKQTRDESEKTSDPFSSVFSHSMMGGSDLMSNLLNGGSLLSNLSPLMNMLSSTRDQDPTMHPMVKKLLYIRRTVFTPTDSKSDEKDDDEPVIKRITYTRIIRLIKISSDEDDTSSEAKTAKSNEHVEKKEAEEKKDEEEEPKKPLKKSKLHKEQEQKDSKTDEKVNTPKVVIVHRPMPAVEKAQEEPAPMERHLVIHQFTPAGEKTIFLKSPTASDDSEADHLVHTTTVHPPSDDDDMPHVIIHRFHRLDDDKPTSDEPMVQTHHVIHVPTESEADSSEASPIHIIHLRENLPTSLFGGSFPSLFGGDDSSPIPVIHLSKSTDDLDEPAKKHAEEKNNKPHHKSEEVVEPTPTEVKTHKDAQEHSDDLMDVMNRLMNGGSDDGDLLSNFVKPFEHQSQKPKEKEPKDKEPKDKESISVPLPSKLSSTSEQIKKQKEKREQDFFDSLPDLFGQPDLD